MIRWLFRWVKRLVLLLLLLAIGLLAPVGYVELACRSDIQANDYAAILPETHHRAEGRTLMTYPEWHIVHAYDDYAEVISTNDPHEFGYLKSIGGFWSSLCALSETVGDHGGFDWPTKQMVYVIGVSFTAELLAKAAYEETLGRVATWIRGSARAPLDDLSARQARDYAAFLRQVPWHQWDFRRDVGELETANSGGFRDRERRFALGVEYSVKASYADVIAAAVESIGPDALTLRMVVRGLSAGELSALDGVTVVGTRPEGMEIETPRYRELTHLLADMAKAGAEFVEIAGNDDILFTVIGTKAIDDAVHAFERQGYGDIRSLVLVKVTELATRLRALEDGALEHVHDY